MTLKVFFALTVTLIFWGSAFVGIRAGLTAYSPGHLALLRFLVASAVLGSYAVFRRIHMPDLKDVPIFLLHGFLGYTVYHVFLNYGEQTVSAGSASFLISSIPVFSILLAVVFLKEHIGFRSLFGVCISVAGVTLIAFGEGGGMTLDGGALLILIAALSESFYIVLQKPYLKRYSALEYVTYTMIAGTIFMFWYLPGFVDAVSTAPFDATLAVIYLGICPAAIAYVTWSYALSQGDVSKIVISQYALPAVTLFIGFFWLREFPAPLALTGGIIALSGVVVITMKKS